MTIGTLVHPHTHNPLCCAHTHSPPTPQTSNLQASRLSAVSSKFEAKRKEWGDAASRFRVRALGAESRVAELEREVIELRAQQAQRDAEVRQGAMEWGRGGGECGGRGAKEVGAHA